jgi:hypothetical protein
MTDDSTRAHQMRQLDDLANVIAFPPRQPRITTYEQATRFFGMGLIEAGTKAQDPEVVALGQRVVDLVPTAP